MISEPSQPVEQAPAHSWRMLWRTLRAQTIHLLATLAAVTLVALLLSSLAVGLQARRDEARTADLLLIVAHTPVAPEFAEHAFELSRRGYAPQIVLVGTGKGTLRAALVERGLPETTLQLGADGPASIAELRAAACAAHALGAATAVVMSEPAELLVLLKAVDDCGLRPYGSPVPGAEPNPLAVVGAGVRYWRYALLQR
jgi:hypothetical protein